MGSGTKVLQCPQCGSGELYYEAGLVTGQKYHCKKCDYIGAFAIERDVVRGEEGSEREAPRPVPGLTIVPFTEADLPFGRRLTDAERWHRTAPDWARLLRLEPEGAFKAVLAGRDVGTAATITYDKVAWVHSVIVRREYRGRGIGDALMRACIRYARIRGIPSVKLDSEEGVEPFYERLGFRREHPSWRLLRDGGSFETAAKRLRPPDQEAVIAFDRERTGLDRGCALREIWADEPDGSFVLWRDGAVRGYVVTQTGVARNPIGPCVADPEDPALAAELLRTALSTAPQGQFRMCVAGANTAAMQVAEGLGFARESHCTRMALGDPFGESMACFAMISAEKG